MIFSVVWNCWLVDPKGIQPVKQPVRFILEGHKLEKLLELEWCRKKLQWTDSVILCRVDRPSRYMVHQWWMGMKRALFPAPGGEY